MSNIQSVSTNVTQAETAVNQDSAKILAPNKQIAANFLSDMGIEGRAVFQVVPESPERKAESAALVEQGEPPLPAPTLYGTLEKLWDELVDYQERGYGVYYTVNPVEGKRRKAENVTGIRALFVDNDYGVPRDNHKQPTIQVWSRGRNGNRRHDIWLLQEPSMFDDDMSLDEREKRFKTAQLTLANIYCKTADLGIHDLPRVMRLPGTLHLKGEPTLVEYDLVGGTYEKGSDILEGLPVRTKSFSKQEKEAIKAGTYNPLEYTETAKSSATPKKSKAKSTGEIEASEDYIRMLADCCKQIEEAPDGEQNNTINKVAYQLGGLFPEQKEHALDALLEAARRGNHPEDRAVKALQSGWESGVKEQIELEAKKTSAAPKASKRKSKLVAGATFFARGDEGISWLIPNRLPSVGTTLLAGAPGAGKSYTAFDLAGCLILGEPFLGETPTVSDARVLFVIGDEPPHFINDRIIKRGLTDKLDNICFLENFRIAEKEVLEEAVREFKPHLIVIDSLTYITQDEEFDENSAKARLPIYAINEIVEQYKTACLLIHHTGKSRDSHGVNKVRGSSAIVGAVSAVWLLYGEPKSAIKTFEISKQRGAETTDFQMTIDYEECRCKALGDVEETISRETSAADRIKKHFLAAGHGKGFEHDELRQQLGGTTESIRRAVQRLCSAGFLQRKPSSINKRRSAFFLNPKIKPLLSSDLNNTDDVAVSGLNVDRVRVSELRQQVRHGSVSHGANAPQSYTGQEFQQVRQTKCDSATANDAVVPLVPSLKGARNKAKCDKPKVSQSCRSNLSQLSKPGTESVSGSKCDSATTYIGQEQSVQEPPTLAESPEFWRNADAERVVPEGFNFV